MILLVRVAERPRERRAGFTALPRWIPGQGAAVDWVPDDELEPIDVRVVRRKSDDLVRLTSLSHLRVVHCGEGRAVQGVTEVCFTAQSELEEFGVEDARITPLDGRFWLTYVAVSVTGRPRPWPRRPTSAPSTITASSSVPRTRTWSSSRRASAGPTRPCTGPTGRPRSHKPEMWLARSPDRISWGRHETLHAGSEAWETGRIGAGPPPLRTAEGWLTLYHGNRYPDRPGEVGAYSAGALLLDLDNPARVLRRTREPILEPTADFERHGFVPDVVFPTGLVETDETLLVYYGAADTCVAVVESRGASCSRACVEGDAPSRLLHRPEHLVQRDRGERAGVVRHRVRDDQRPVVDHGAAAVDHVRHVALPFVFIGRQQRLGQPPITLDGSSRSSRNARHGVLPHRPDAVAQHEPARLGFDRAAAVADCTYSHGNVGLRISCLLYQKCRCRSTSGRCSRCPAAKHRVKAVHLPREQRKPFVVAPPAVQRADFEALEVLRLEELWEDQAAERGHVSCVVMDAAIVVVKLDEPGVLDAVRLRWRTREDGCSDRPAPAQYLIS